jgi:hydroxylamine reductase
MSMFCYQCEQTAKETGCTSFGVCGKDPETAALQDLLTHIAKGIGWYGSRLNKSDKGDHYRDTFLIEALFTTVTNVNFDPDTLATMIRTGHRLLTDAREAFRRLSSSGNVPSETHPAYEAFELPVDTDGLINLGEQLSPWSRAEKLGSEISGLGELIMYGLKGTAAYAQHARVLGVEDQSVYDYMNDCLAFLAGEPTDPEKLLAEALRVGEVNLKVMEMLDTANTGTYGHPVPTKVRTTPVAGKCILVSGHDLKDLAALLEQTEGKGINVYTHGEMLPCHGYPELNKYPHLVGNYGGAWQDQRKEFEAFPGAILMTTNCIQKPKENYTGRLFTSGLVQWPGIPHIDDHDFTAVIESALAADGFPEDAEPAFTMTGFGHNAVMSVAPQVIDAVKAGQNPALLPHRGLRRRQVGPQLLH